MPFALAARRIFDGEKFLEDHAVLVDGGRILALRPVSTVTGNTPVKTLDGLLAPGFIDVQVNGGGGAFFNQAPSLDVIRAIAESHRKHGTTGLLPTIITDEREVLQAAISAAEEAHARKLPGFLGIHIEGPFLDPARKGAHDPRFIRLPTEADIVQIASARCGATMLTVAPNMVTPAQISKLHGKGVLVSLGHSEATHQQAKAALEAGASAFTHLFNAMSQLTGREPGMVGAALESGSSYIGIIADGHHVSDASLRIALAAANHSRFMLVTDAMPPAAGGPDLFEIQGRKVLRRGDRLELADGTLAGSNLTMDAAVRHCAEWLGVSLEAALQMASLNPARFLNRQNDLGRIAPGYLANLVHLDSSLRAVETWIEGK